MSSKLPIPAAAALAAAALVASAGTANAEILIDLGNDSSYRGASVTNPDSNGNTWTSVWSGAFYENIPDAEGNATDVDFGFTTAGGTDSYNGPAGVNPTNGNPNPPSAADFDPSLGSLGVGAAVFDFYTNSTFQLQNLDPGSTYDLTFFGSHKYNFNNTTRYTIYTDVTFLDAVASADLFVGMDDAHNTSQTVTIGGLSPQEDGILYVGFRGTNEGEGYLNALRIDVQAVPEPAAALSLLGLGLAGAMRRRRP